MSPAFVFNELNIYCFSFLITSDCRDAELKLRLNLVFADRGVK